MESETICYYCGEKLPHEKCSEVKKPDPTELTKKARQEWKDTANIHSKPYSWCLEACEEIDRLTIQNAHTKGLNKVLVNNAQKSLDEIDRLTAELNTADEKRVTEQAGRTEAENECCVLRGEVNRLTASCKLFEVMISDLHAELKAKDKERANLKEFARAIIKESCWGYTELDGGTTQDLAIRLGLIESFIATEIDVDPEFDDFEVGDMIYRFTDVLKGE